jgi:hypothetical protein
MKHGSGINGRDDRSIGVEIHMTDLFSKINPTDPLRLSKQITRRKRNWSDSSGSWLTTVDASRWVCKKSLFGMVDWGKLDGQSSILHLVTVWRTPSDSGTPSELVVWVSCPIGWKIVRPKRVWGKVKSRIRVRGGVRRLSCSWVFLQDYVVFYLNITPFFTCLQMISIQIIMKICYMYTTKEVQLKPESVHKTRSEPNLPKWKREPIIICVTFDVTEEIQGSPVKVWVGLSPGSIVTISKGKRGCEHNE